MRHPPNHPRLAQRRAARLVLALLIGAAIAPAAAHGDSSLAAAVKFPTPVTAGTTGHAGSLTLVYTSTPDEGALELCNAGQGGDCSGQQGITVTPACGKPGGFPACTPAGADPGVFALSATAGGAIGSACAGVPFTVTPLGGTYGAYRFTPAGGARVRLGPGFLSFCQIEFTFDVLKVPAVDAKPDVEGLQTIPIGEAFGTTDGGDTAAAQDPASAITVLPAPLTPGAPGDGAGGAGGGGGGAGGSASRPEHPGCPSFIYEFVGTGGAGADRLTGGRRTDIIHALGGADLVIGGAGRDCLYGEAGADNLQGRAAADYLFGGAGRDRLLGQTGGDRIDGGAGNDKLVGGAGADRLSGGGGADLIDAVDPTARDRRLVDRITCGAGRDIVRADPRDDVASDCERVVRRR